MPGYYSRPMAGQLPLTPPDSGSRYGYGNIPFPPQDSYQSHPAMTQARHESAFAYPHGYIPSGPPPYQYGPADYSAPNSLPPIQSYYEPIGAPILPPLRINERGSFPDTYQRRLEQEQRSMATREQQQQHRNHGKEEKPTGGVSAKLDYDMESMTDFVTEAVQSIFQHHMQRSPAFRKWVHQVLSATRLPSATILLSLHYLNDRVANFPDSVTPSENQIYRLLSVALILGSKFLDDNTFINRSWSDVTGIKVSELNLLEMKWLHLINYELHIDPKVPNGVQAWIDAWRKYEAEYSPHPPPSRLSPPKSDLRQSQASPRDHQASYPTPYTASARPSHAHFGNAGYDRSDSRGNLEPMRLEEYYKSRRRYPAAGDMHNANLRAADAYNYPAIAHPSYYSTSTYAPTWDAGAWSGVHAYDCTCSSCSYQQYPPYMMAPSYAAQTVMG